MHIPVNCKNIKACIHLPKLIISIDGVDYYASDASHIIEFEGDFVINFTKNPNLPSNQFSELASHFDLGFSNEIQVPWPDFSLPKVKSTFWRALHNFVKNKGWTKVCFHCQMSHGRTGTALATMMIILDHWTAIDALSWVREHHCKDAVESFDQCKYLECMDFEYNHKKPDSNNPLKPSMMSGNAYGYTEYIKNNLK